MITVKVSKVWKNHLFSLPIFGRRKGVCSSRLRWTSSQQPIYERVGLVTVVVLPQRHQCADGVIVIPLMEEGPVLRVLRDMLDECACNGRTKVSTSTPTPVGIFHDIFLSAGRSFWPQGLKFYPAGHRVRRLADDLSTLRHHPHSSCSPYLHDRYLRFPDTSNRRGRHGGGAGWLRCRRGIRTWRRPTRRCGRV